MAIYNDVKNKITAGSGIAISSDTTGAVVIEATGSTTVLTTSEIVLKDPGSNYTVSIASPSLTASSAYHWPSVIPTAGQALIAIDNIGNLGWGSVTYDLNSLSDVTITATSIANNQVLKYDLASTQWINGQLDHAALSNIGTNSHAAIDTFIASLNQNGGIAGLDLDGKVKLSQIPSISLTSVNVVATIASRDALTNIQSGDVAIVTNDSTPSNNGSYMYNGTSWSTLSVYIQPTNLTSLSDVSMSGIDNDHMMVFKKGDNKWENYSVIGATFDDVNKTITISSATEIVKKVISITSNLTITKDSKNYVDVGYVIVATDNIVITFPAAPLQNTRIVITSSIYNVIVNPSGSDTITNSSLPTMITREFKYVGTNWSNVDGANYSFNLLENEIINVYTHASVILFLPPYPGDGSTIKINNFGSSALSITASSINRINNNVVGYSYSLLGSNYVVVSFVYYNGNWTSSSSFNYISNLIDCNINNPLTNQVLSYNGSKWTNTTPTSGATSLSLLTDCSVSSVTNNQLLVYTTTSGLNKWTPYTLAGATFNDTAKTITISASSGTATALQSASSVVNVSSATAPGANQALVATSGTAATWQQISHLNLSNVGTNTHATIDAFLSKFNIGTLTDKDILRYSSSSGKIVNVQDLTNVENSITNLQLSAGIIKSNNATTQGATIVTTYVDGADGNIVNVNNSAPYYNNISAYNITATGPTFGMNGFYIFNNIQLTTSVSPFSGIHNNTIFSAYMRINFDFNTAFQISQIAICSTTNESGTWYYNCTQFNVYGSNSSGSFNDTSSSSTSLTLLGSFIPTGNGVTEFFSISNSTLFRYVHIIGVYNAASGKSKFECKFPIGGGIWIQHAAGGYIPLMINSGFTVQADSSTGRPAITYTNSSTANLTYNLNTLNIYELNRRIYPVIRDSGTLLLTSSTNASPAAGNIWYDTATSKFQFREGATTNTLLNTNITSVANGNLMSYDSATSKWINTNSLTDALNFIKDDVDGTKKMRFELSGVSSGSTRILSIPDASITLVGQDNTQTLTNKILTDSTNNIMAKSLKSATTTVVVSNALAPTPGQALIAISATEATWQAQSLGNQPIITGGMFFDSAGAGGWGIGMSPTQFSINSNNVLQSILLDTSGNIKLKNNVEVTNNLTVDNNLTVNNISSTGYMKSGSLCLSYSQCNYVLDSEYVLIDPIIEYQYGYQCDNFSYCFFCESPARHGSYILLPEISSGKTIYFQIISTSASYDLYFYSPTNSYPIPIFTATDTMNPRQPAIYGNTYALTHYTNGSNPYDISHSLPSSWYLMKLGLNILPLADNTSFFTINSKNTSLPINICMPSNPNPGQILYIKDVGGYNNISTVNLFQSNNNKVNGNTAIVINSSNFIQKFIYIGSGSNGNWVSI